MNKYRVPDAPKGMILNPDKKRVDIIVSSLATKTNGLCPCVPRYLHEGENKEDYRCVCKEARETGICRCELFV